MGNKKYQELLKLRGKIIAEGYDLKTVAKKIGLSYNAFRNKIKGETAFTINEVYELAVILNIDKEEIITYFFEEMLRNAGKGA